MWRDDADEVCVFIYRGVPVKVPVYSLAGKVKGQVSLDRVFSSQVRTDLIIRGFLAERSKQRQPYGADTLAGMRSSAHYHGRRHARNTMMNREIARMARIHGQGFLNFTARIVPQAVKGRKAHPPKAAKIWELKLNKKERSRAIISALAASADKEKVIARGHKLNGIEKLPLVVEDKLQALKKTKDAVSALKALGLSEELERVKEKKVRAGKGKTRGRRYRRKKGPLLIVKEDRGIVKAAENIAGVEVADPNSLTVGLLAPGSLPGRIVIWTKSAIEGIREAGWFK